MRAFSPSRQGCFRDPDERMERARALHPRHRRSRRRRALASRATSSHVDASLGASRGLAPATAPTSPLRPALPQRDALRHHMRSLRPWLDPVHIAASERCFVGSGDSHRLLQHVQRAGTPSSDRSLRVVEAATSPTLLLGGPPSRRRGEPWAADCAPECTAPHVRFPAGIGTFDPAYSSTSRPPCGWRYRWPLGCRPSGRAKDALQPTVQLAAGRVPLLDPSRVPIVADSPHQRPGGPPHESDSA